MKIKENANFEVNNIPVLPKQITNMAAHFYPVFLRLAQAAIPEGVTLNIHEHDKSHDHIRYVPDNDLKDLKSQLEDLGGARKKKRKK